MSTLYIVEPDSALKVKHQQFQVFRQQELLFKVPVLQVKNIILFGYCHLSYGVVQTALYNQIPITYYSAQGYYSGCLQSQLQPKVTYLIEQVRQADNNIFVRQQAEIIVSSNSHFEKE